MGKKKRTAEEIALSAKRRAEFKDKIEARLTKLDAQGNKPGAVILSHIPHGFYEPQMLDYFSQFGHVTRLKLVRSKKTGKSRQFAFIEFQFEEVARIVAQTMNNYLMYQKILKCKLLPPENIRPCTFKNWKYRYHVPKTRKQAIRRHNTEQTDPRKIEWKKQKVAFRRGKLQNKLNELGIEYDVFNVKFNESFVLPKRSRASKEAMEKLREVIPEIDERCSDFDYSDDEPIEDGDDSINQEIKSSKTDEVTQRKKKSPKRQLRRYTETTDKDFGTMVVDLEDPEVTFKSPPAEAKIRRKSIRLFETARKTTDESDDPDVTRRKRSLSVSSKERRLLKLKLLQMELDCPDVNDVGKISPSKMKAIAIKEPATAKKGMKKKRVMMNKTM